MIQLKSSGGIMLQRFYRRRLRENLEELYYTEGGTVAFAWVPRGLHTEQLEISASQDFRLHGFTLPDHPRFVKFALIDADADQMGDALRFVPVLRGTYNRAYLVSSLDSAWMLIGAMAGFILWRGPEHVDLDWPGIVALIVGLVFSCLGLFEFLERYWALRRFNVRLNAIHTELRRELGL